MKQYWIPIEEYNDFKLGDSVRRNDGGRDVEGNLWNTEGVIIAIEHWHENKDSVSFRVAENGNLRRIVLLRPHQVEKINKEFKLHENGKMTLF